MLGTLLAGCGQQAHVAPPPVARVGRAAQFSGARRAVAVVDMTAEPKVVYQGAPANIAKEYVKPGQIVSSGASVVRLDSGIVLSAPQSGTILSVLPNGTMIGAVPAGVPPLPTTIAVMAQTQPMTVTARLPKVEDGVAHAYHTVALHYGGKHYSGNITKLTSNASDVVLQAVFASAPLLGLGQHLVISLKEPVLHHVLVVPTAAIRRVGSGHYGVMLQNGHVEPVHILQVSALKTAVKGKLSPGQSVRISGDLGSRFLKPPGVL